MHRLLDRGLEDLTTMVFKMGEVAAKALQISIGGFVKGRDTSEDAQELSEILVAMTAEVEEKAFSLIAKYQPVASDLRIINSYMKIAYDFERFGRYAWDITSIAKRVDVLRTCQEWISEFVGDMGERVLEMVNISIDSLKTLDTDLAKSMAKTEQEVDDMYFRFLDRLVEEAGTTNECTIASVLAVRYLERTADHAAYIAEAVVYIATGKKITIR
ncbi:MAG: phosphate signaling complex protein PhoU [Candidatus Bathyarchaeia archaeon]